MSEYWKSTPRYWCKHCSCYVRDTKLEKQNHESTAKHQGALKRSLRDLHRNHEREEREKERARQEIARLNGVVSGFGSGAATAARPAQPTVATEAERKRQREQLAELGVAVPGSLRADMAMAGEWTVTSTRVIADGEVGQGAARTEAVATGVRKREEATEEQRDEEEAVRRLFKKPRKWGKDWKLVGQQDEDRELEALLSGTVMTVKTRRGDGDAEVKGEDVEVKGEEMADNDQTGAEATSSINREESEAASAVSVKKEAEEEEPGAACKQGVAAADVKPEAAVVFKKRKPKGIRTR